MQHAWAAVVWFRTAACERGSSINSGNFVDQLSDCHLRKRLVPQWRAVDAPVRSRPALSTAALSSGTSTFQARSISFDFVYGLQVFVTVT
jgi:hypothetical protein